MIVAYSKTEFRILFNLDGFTWKCPAEAELVLYECICLERVNTSQGFRCEIVQNIMHKDGNCFKVEL